MIEGSYGRLLLWHARAGFTLAALAPAVTWRRPSALHDAYPDADGTGCGVCV